MRLSHWIFLTIRGAYAPRSSLQPALAPLEAFEIIAVIARTAAIEAPDILTATRFIGGAVERDLAYDRLMGSEERTQGIHVGIYSRHLFGVSDLPVV